LAGFEPWSAARGAAIIAAKAGREGAALPILHALQAEFGGVPSTRRGCSTAARWAGWMKRASPPSWRPRGDNDLRSARYLLIRSESPCARRKRLDPWVREAVGRLTEKQVS
jgi:hypothetical protein